MIDSEIERNSLLSLGAMAVRVRVSSLEELCQVPLRADVERWLSQAGITALALEDWERAPGRPALYVLGSVPYRGEDGRCLCRFQVELYQEVFLSRAPSLSAWTATWQAERFLLLKPSEDARACRDALFALVEAFLRAHRSVNP